MLMAGLLECHWYDLKGKAKKCNLLTSQSTRKIMHNNSCAIRSGAAVTKS